jgi:trans-aconitate 2-methyltransferase
MTRDAWNPDQYERFKAERSAPFFDLLALVRPKPAMRVVDLGCGPGNLTRAMHEKLGARETLGVDSSDAMLAKARGESSAGLRFERGDLATFVADAPFDLVFSNAAIHWVDDHAALLARLARALAPGGQLAVQVPANHDHDATTIAAKVAAEFGALPRVSPVLAPEAYAAILHWLGMREQHVRLQVYPHVLASREDVVEWVKGTLLTDYEKRMSADAFARFLAAYRERLMSQLPDERPFFYPFKRVLFWAARAG